MTHGHGSPQLPYSPVTVISGRLPLQSPDLCCQGRGGSSWSHLPCARLRASCLSHVELLSLAAALWERIHARKRLLAKLSSVGSISEEETCEKLKGLIQRQVQMCKRNLEVMDSVRRGAQLAIEECQYQFRNRRWNCSTLDSLPVFGKVVTQGEGGARGRGRGGQLPGRGDRCSGAGCH